MRDLSVCELKNVFGGLLCKCTDPEQEQEMDDKASCQNWCCNDLQGCLYDFGGSCGVCRLKPISELGGLGYDPESLAYGIGWTVSWG